jgi:hypothetical protein
MIFGRFLVRSLSCNELDELEAANLRYLTSYPNEKYLIDLFSIFEEIEIEEGVIIKLSLNSFNEELETRIFKGYIRDVISSREQIKDNLQRVFLKFKPGDILVIRFPFVVRPLKGIEYREMDKGFGTTLQILTEVKIKKAKTVKIVKEYRTLDDEWETYGRSPTIELQ